MKKIFFSLLMVMTVISISLFTTSCQKEEVAAGPVLKTGTIDWRANQNSLVYPITAHPYGKSYGEWTASWWQHVLSSDCENNPILDVTGEFTGVNQSGPVYFLFGTFGQTVTRSATIPAGKPVLFPLVNMYWQYPCPSPLGDEPAPGQTMEEFLTAICALSMDGAANLSATLDGVELTNLDEYRAVSDLFTYTGNIELASCFDGCINGLPQPAVADGYWLMLKPLSPGSHTLHFTGGLPDLGGFLVDVTYNLMVE